MAGLLDLLAQNLTGSHAQQIAQTIGAPQDQTQRAIGAALPAILTALNRNTNTTQGAAQLSGALARDHDGSLLDQLGSYLSGQTAGASKQTDGAGILGHLLGSERQTVEQGVAKASGLDLSQVAKLLPLLAPIVMAVLGRTKREKNLDDAGLSGILGQEAQRARAAAPGGLLGALSGFLDRDGDGEVKDDLLAQAGRAALGSLFGR